MLNSKVISICLFLIFSLATHAQKGYQRKTNVFSITGLGNSPIFSGFYKTPIHKFKGETYTAGKERINYGFGASFVHQQSRKFGFGLEINQKYFKINAPEYYLTNKGTTKQNVEIDSSFLRMEQLGVHTTSFLIRLEFSNPNGIGPAGIIHNLSLGYGQSQITNKAYKYSLNEFGTNEKYNDSWTAVDQLYLPEVTEKLGSIILSYGLVLRYPLTKQLTMDAGINYFYNFYEPKKAEILNQTKIFPYDYSTVYHNIKRENFVNCNVKFGFSFIF